MKVVLLFLVPFVLAQTPVTRAIPGTAGRMIKSADLREHLAVLRRGKTLGTADRGKSARHQWGAFFFLSLPKSQIEMDLPIISNFPVSPQPDAGLIPDLVVTPTLQDIADGLDVEMAALEVLRRSERN